MGMGTTQQWTQKSQREHLLSLRAHNSGRILFFVSNKQQLPLEISQSRATLATGGREGEPGCSQLKLPSTGFGSPYKFNS